VRLSQEHRLAFLLLPRLFGFFQTPFPPRTFNVVADSIVSGKTIIITLYALHASDEAG